MTETQLEKAARIALAIEASGQQDAHADFQTLLRDWNARENLLTRITDMAMTEDQRAQALAILTAIEEAEANAVMGVREAAYGDCEHALYRAVARGELSPNVAALIRMEMRGQDGINHSG